jgi:hypothetical protein
MAPSTQKMKEDTTALFNEQREEIDQAVVHAVKIIYEATSEAAKKVNESAEKSLVMSNKDHDLLIELKTAMNFIRDDIKNLSDGITKKVDDLEKNKADRKTVDDLITEIRTTREDRLKTLELKVGNFSLTEVEKLRNTVKWFTLAAGALFLIMLYHIFHVPIPL